MNSDLPHHLEEVRRMLAASLRVRDDETAPPIPADLLDELTRCPETPVLAAPPNRSGFARIFRWLSNPAFGAIAVLVFVLSLAGPRLFDLERRDEGFRGSPTVAVPSADIQIVLLGASPELRRFFESSRDFSSMTIASLAAPGELDSISGRRVVLDFGTPRLFALDAAGREIHSAALPSDLGELSLAVATAISRID